LNFGFRTESTWIGMENLVIVNVIYFIDSFNDSDAL
jgi:hypothetical protein